MITKHKLSPHQRQLRFFAFLFGGLLVLLVGGLMWFISRLPPAGN